jgi:hypothetical protein
MAQLNQITARRKQTFFFLHLPSLIYLHEPEKGFTTLSTRKDALSFFANEESLVQ